MFYWIDSTARLAYINVRGPLPHFERLLQLFDSLFADPRWQPDMAIIEDMRELTEEPPSTCIADWRTYLQERRFVLPRRWASVLPPAASPRLRAILAAAAADAACCNLPMQLFTRMSDAHVWLARRDIGTPRRHSIGVSPTHLPLQ
jgi:hypothetical protein